jgi:putative Holliday junction resolvase
VTVRALGLDVGSRRIGVALSDELGITAQPLVVLAVKGLRDAAARIAGLCAEHEVGTIVVGLPLSLSGGDRGSSSARARELAGLLAAAVPAEIVLWDERFTTAEAERVLVQGNVRRAARRAVVDKIAAALILQGWLDAR